MEDSINNNVASNEPQFAGEWGDTPGGPEDGPQFPESPKQNAPQAHQELEDRRRSLKKEKPVNQSPVEEKSPRPLNQNNAYQQRIMQRAQLAKIR